MKLAVLLAMLIAGVVADTHDNCFTNDHLTYAYDLHSFSSNYTNNQEFWLKLDTTCSFRISRNTKVSWYSSDISAKYLMFYDNNDGAQCRKDPNGLVDYDNGYPIDLGKTSEFFPNSCMVLYEVTNKNKVHDLRVQIYQYEGDRLDSISLKAYSLVAMVAIGLSSSIF